MARLAVPKSPSVVIKLDKKNAPRRENMQCGVYCVAVEMAGVADVSRLMHPTMEWHICVALVLGRRDRIQFGSGMFTVMNIQTKITRRFLAGKFRGMCGWEASSRYAWCKLKVNLSASFKFLVCSTTLPCLVVSSDSVWSSEPLSNINDASG